MLSNMFIVKHALNDNSKAQQKKDCMLNNDDIVIKMELNCILFGDAPG